MLKYLRVFVLVVKIDGLKTLGTGYGLIDELTLAVAVGLSHWYFVHDAGNLLLCVSDAIKTHVEYHTGLWKFIAFLADLEQFVGLVELIGGHEGFKNDAAFGVTAESWAQMSAGDVVDLLDHHWASPQRELQFELDEFPLMGARLDFGVFFEETFIVRHRYNFF